MTDRSVGRRRRQEIIDSARTVFSRLGYAGTAMDDVAEEAGIAKGTLYLYFKSKEDLYMAALVHDLREMSDRIRREMEKVKTFREKLLAFLTVRLEYAKTHEDFLRIYLAEYGSMFVKAPIRSELFKLARENMRTLAAAVEHAMAAGELRETQAGPVAGAIFDVARGMLERRLLAWKELQARDEVNFAADLLWQGMGGKTPGKKRANAS